MSPNASRRARRGRRAVPAEARGAESADEGLHERRTPPPKEGPGGDGPHAGEEGQHARAADATGAGGHPARVEGGPARCAVGPARAAEHALEVRAGPGAGALRGRGPHRGRTGGRG
ncbi:hypothetical protein [Leptolyngbya sp. 7M]|uniref:hypothetical protein n=1 Tax=Leptolyngbya sp. 7M TaxID=2812896 RepID=UPI001B8B9FCD|nr:hypothetical protein [Leptolyngbya sp. 7M]QYO63949.1 hypothetical protein JVX88_29775 [Leptolyngbya sp. 7M]